jgi:hypothetical protein
VAALLAGETGETQYRVQFNRMRCDTGLAVVEVEERDARDARSSAEPYVASRNTHLASPLRSGVAVAIGAGAFV